MKRKNNKGMITVGGLVVLAIVIIVCVALFSASATPVGEMTSKLSVSNEQSNLQTLGCYTDAGQVNESVSACNITVDAWYAVGDWRRSESQCYLSSVSVTNDTQTALTLNTDYKLYASSGLIQLLNTTTTANSSATLGDNIVEVDYSYCGQGYNKDGGSRSMAGLILVLMALALVAFVLDASGVVDLGLTK